MRCHPRRLSFRRFVLVVVVGLLAVSHPFAAGANHAGHPQVADVPGVDCGTRVVFSPHGDTTATIVEEIAKAGSTIHVALYSLTHPDLVAALIEAKGRGVEVALRLDWGQTQRDKQQRQAIQRLRSAGVSVEVSARSRRLHNKFAVIDGRRILTGSFNWTKSAEDRNQENVLILDCADLARLYEQEWDGIE